MSKRRGIRLRTWIVVSILIHVGLVLVPGRVLEFFYPREVYTMRRPWPGVDFEFVPSFEIPDPHAWQRQLPEGMHLLLPAEVDEEEVPSTEPEVRPPAMPSAETGTQGVEASPGEPGGTPLAAQFFPAVPRYIVPPTLQDLGVESIDINVRILVNVRGQPDRILLPDTLSNEEIRQRVLAAARKFRFQPARRGDTPVESWVDLPLVVESAASR
jgi:hypothetical protein